MNSHAHMRTKLSEPAHHEEKMENSEELLLKGFIQLCFFRMLVYLGKKQTKSKDSKIGKFGGFHFFRVLMCLALANKENLEDPFVEKYIKDKLNNKLLLIYERDRLFSYYNITKINTLQKLADHFSNLPDKSILGDGNGFKKEMKEMIAIALTSETQKEKFKKRQQLLTVFSHLDISAQTVLDFFKDVLERPVSNDKNGNDSFNGYIQNYFLTFIDYLYYKLKNNSAITNREHFNELLKILDDFIKEDTKNKETLGTKMISAKPPKEQEHGKHFIGLIKDAAKNDRHPFFLELASKLKLTSSKVTEMFEETKKCVGDTTRSSQP